MIIVKINGKTRETNAVNIDGLLKENNLVASRVAVELNGVIINRDNFVNQRISDNDNISIIGFVGGG